MVTSESLYNLHSTTPGESLDTVKLWYDLI